MSKGSLAALCGLALLSAACGGTSPTGPPPTSELHDVDLVVFDDANGNGRLDAQERTRVGGVMLRLGIGAGRSNPGTGQVQIQGVEAGSYEVKIRADSLPPYFLPGESVLVEVPQAPRSVVPVPLRLPIGSNIPDTYLAFGDSISIGDGSSDGTGYRSPLEAELESFFGVAQVLNGGSESAGSDDGADLIGRFLASRRPGRTLILFGTNDWNDWRCKGKVPCFTVDSLRAIVQACHKASSLPFLATIIPANPAHPLQVPPERNNWVHAIDELVRPMAKKEGAVLVDLEKAFLAEGDLTQLFADHVHPNDRGYQIMAREFYRAVTQSPGLSGSLDLAPRSFGFDQPAWRGAPLRLDRLLPHGGLAPSQGERPSRRKAA
jgi:lysophospholipase L1-like esterase